MPTFWSHCTIHQDTLGRTCLSWNPCPWQACLHLVALWWSSTSWGQACCKNWCPTWTDNAIFRIFKHSKYYKQHAVCYMQFNDNMSLSFVLPCIDCPVLDLSFPVLSCVHTVLCPVLSYILSLYFTRPCSVLPRPWISFHTFPLTSQLTIHMTTLLSFSQ